MQKNSGKSVNTLASWVVYGWTYQTLLYIVDCSTLFQPIKSVYQVISISGFCQGTLTQDRYTNFIGYSLGVYQNNTVLLGVLYSNSFTCGIRSIIW